jgi:hypothetical protein
VCVLDQIEKLQRLCVAFRYSKLSEEVNRSDDEQKALENQRDGCVCVCVCVRVRVCVCVVWESSSLSCRHAAWKGRRGRSNGSCLAVTHSWCVWLCYASSG